jgi:hypothetical protein
VNAAAIDHNLSLIVSEVRDLGERVRRGEFDGCDPALLRSFNERATELRLAIVVQYNRVPAPI